MRKPTGLQLKSNDPGYLDGTKPIPDHFDSVQGFSADGKGYLIQRIGEGLVDSAKDGIYRSSDKPYPAGNVVLVVAAFHASEVSRTDRFVMITYDGLVKSAEPICAQASIIQRMDLINVKSDQLGKRYGEPATMAIFNMLKEKLCK